MSEPIPGGRRRVDRVLGEGFLDGLTEMSLQEVRQRRFDAEQEDADLSYIRRLLQGRMDIIRAEQQRRHAAAGAADPVVDQLPQVLGAGERPAPHGLGRYLNVEPSRVAENRRRVEQVVSDPALSNVASMTDAQLAAAHDELVGYERTVSGIRHRVQQVMDQLTAEITRRYRDGEASVDELLQTKHE
jgi:hypothetical protein